ncbi:MULTISPECIES: hydroxyacid dehydrogenase [Bacillus]|uniref:Phosphoglycerate dehydrogenase-like enzyme n=1 Tax=Bacillus capparidis TaxID=1840411 RepID=A0ABS4CSL3_9BACI|nr:MULTISPECIES: hydroxyacid dehydrogenase [Bacillus]MBP1080556.1 phosphoglycerate dehydrogenase-like enzyme [Bacillus capparidis]MED1094412.1 hydroxyacid dehydrogenase [Bacillus capparidis]
MLNGLFILDDCQLVYGSVYKEIEKMVRIYELPQTKESIIQNPSLLEKADVLFTGWGCPVMDQEFLKSAPNLKAVFYGAGSIKHVVTKEFWERQIQITSAFAANAVPVAEFSLSQILFSLKRGWNYVNQVKKERKYPVKFEVPGAYHSIVGIISLGMIGRKVCELLKPFDLTVIAYDPYVSKEEAKALNVQLCSLEELFQVSDVVSIHTPLIKETEGMITGHHIHSMKKNATFINTSRGAVVRESDAIEVLESRPDLFAVLDVTSPEPPSQNSRLFSLDNVILTPHIAGSLSKECERMGEYMAEEAKRYIEGRPMKWEITREIASTMA